MRVPGSRPTPGGPGWARATATAAAVAISSALALAACADVPPDPASLVSVEDSAGVRIVTSHWPGERHLPVWMLDTVPELTIGDPAPTEDHALHEVVFPTSLPDGRIVVPQAGTTIALFGPDGSFLRRIGRQGEGPGEFRYFGYAFAVGQSGVSVLELPADRLLHFDATTGDFLGDGPRGEEGGVASMQFPLADGRLAGFFSSTRDTLRLGLLPPSGGDPVLFASLPLPETRYRETGYPPADMRPYPWTYAAGRRVWAGWGGVYQIHAFDPEGGPAQIVRAQFPMVPVARRVRDSILESRAAEHAAYRPTPGVIDVPPRQFAVPDSFPAFELLLGSREGSLWVRRAGYLTDPAGIPWDVFAPDGRFRARIVVPPRFRPSEVSETHVLGVWTGAYDVQSVRRLRIVKEG